MTRDQEPLRAEVISMLSQSAMEEGSEAIRASVGRHPEGSTCGCPLIEGVLALYKLGYRLTIPAEEAAA